MSPIGRIFIFINLVLAAVFLGAGASFLAGTDRYRTMYETEVRDRGTEVKDYADQIKALNEQVGEAERIADDMRNKKTQLETELEGVRGDLQSEKLKLTQLQEQWTSVSATLETMSSQMEAVNERATEAQGMAMAAVQEKAEALAAQKEAMESREEIERQYNEVQMTVADLERQLNTTKGELESVTTTLDVVKSTYDITDQDISGVAPKIDGSVLSVDTVAGAQFVYINRGSVDSVKRGYIFDIYDGAIYKGRAKVELVNDSSCTARILVQKEGTSVSSGDTVTTQI